MKCPDIPEVQKSFWCSFKYVPLLYPLENIQMALVDRLFGNSFKICTFGWEHTYKGERPERKRRNRVYVCTMVLIFLYLKVSNVLTEIFFSTSY